MVLDLNLVATLATRMIPSGSPVCPTLYRMVHLQLLSFVHNYLVQRAALFLSCHLWSILLFLHCFAIFKLHLNKFTPVNLYFHFHFMKYFPILYPTLPSITLLVSHLSRAPQGFFVNDPVIITLQVIPTQGVRCKYQVKFSQLPLVFID